MGASERLLSSTQRESSSRVTNPLATIFDSHRLASSSVARDPPRDAVLAIFRLFRH
jgi:hypothetical protein